jgi:hypothetical protein
VVATEIETVLQRMLDRLVEIGKYFGVEMTVGKTKVTSDYDRSKTAGEFRIFQLFW